MTKKTTSENNNIPLIWKRLAIVLSVSLLILAGFIVYKFCSTFSGSIFPGNERTEWGTLGDFFGGTLNPIFSFLSFIALLVTIIYQAKSLKLSSEELELSRIELKGSKEALTAQNRAIELQSFEQTFFSWLETYQSLLASIEDEARRGGLSNSSEIIIKTGRSQLFEWWESTLNEKVLWGKLTYNNKEKNIFPDSSITEAYQLRPQNRAEEHYLLTLAKLHTDIVTNYMLSEWNKLYLAEEYQLDNLFRTLYRLFVWIDSQQESRLTNAQKWLYISIVRSQLSWIEMAYLYLNGLTERGRKFKPIAEKYALFDNLTFSSDAALEVLKLHLKAPVGYAFSADDSITARAKLRLPISSEDTLSLATTTLSY